MTSPLACCFNKVTNEFNIIMNKWFNTATHWHNSYKILHNYEYNYYIITTTIPCWRTRWWGRCHHHSHRRCNQRRHYWWSHPPTQRCRYHWSGPASRATSSPRSQGSPPPALARMKCHCLIRWHVRGGGVTMHPLPLYSHHGLLCAPIIGMWNLPALSICKYMCSFTWLEELWFVIWHKKELWLLMSKHAVKHKHILVGMVKWAPHSVVCLDQSNWLEQLVKLVFMGFTVKTNKCLPERDAITHPGLS
jgi:hypothetical protein